MHAQSCFSGGIAKARLSWEPLLLRPRQLRSHRPSFISAHSFRATGITTYLQNGGKLEVAQQMAGHQPVRPRWSTAMSTQQAGY